MPAAACLATTAGTAALYAVTHAVLRGNCRIEATKVVVWLPVAVRFAMCSSSASSRATAA